MRFSLVFVVFLLSPLYAWANSSVYSPEFCEFSMAFPEEPYTVRRCDEDNQNRCYDLVSFTKVFDLRATVNFRVICTPIDPSVREAYSGEVMEATVRAMTKKTVIREFNTSFTEEEGYKMAGLVGEGYAGRLPTIYIAQLWIGEQSAFSVEAELIGDISDQADALYSSVLRTIHHKDVP